MVRLDIGLPWITYGVDDDDVNFAEKKKQSEERSSESVDTMVGKCGRCRWERCQVQQLAKSGMLLHTDSSVFKSFGRVT